MSLDDLLLNDWAATPAPAPPIPHFVVFAATCLAAVGAAGWLGGLWIYDKFLDPRR